VHDVVKSIALIVERLATGGGGAGAPREIQHDTHKSPVLLVLRGTQRADLARVASHLEVGRKQLRMATPSECVAVFGYPPGSMPPLGLRQPDTLTLVDPAVVRPHFPPWRKHEILENVAAPQSHSKTGADAAGQATVCRLSQRSATMSRDGVMSR
jgi:hypothetical protein